MSKKIYRLSIALLLSASAGAAHAGVFKCTRADGKTAFQDQPCAANESSKVINIPSAAQRESSDPLMAAAIVYGVNASLEHMQSWCGGVDSATLGPIEMARQDWKRKHAALLDKTNTILQMRLSGDERARLASQMRQEGLNITRRLSAAAHEDKLQWCMTAPVTIASPQMDLLARPILTKTIMGAR